MSPIPYSSVDRMVIARQPFIYPSDRDIYCGLPLIVEIGPGRGDFLFHLARSNPEARVVGVEIKYLRVDKLIARAEMQGLSNLVLVQDDARLALPRIFKDCSVDAIYVLFPDPWPKTRHSKNRAVSTGIIEEGARILKKGGSINITTDHRPYAVEIARAAKRISSIRSAHSDVIVEDPDGVFPTLFAKKWRDMGRSFYHQLYLKE